MKNKVLIKLEVPSLNETFDLFLPVNEILWKINKMLVKCVSDLSNGCFDTTKEYFLANKTTGKIYENNYYKRKPKNK